MQQAIHPQPPRVRIATDIGIALIALCLLLPHLFGVAGGTTEAKVMLLGGYIAIVVAVASLAVAGRAEIRGSALAFMLFAAPYTLVLVAKPGGLEDAAYMVMIVITVTVAAHLQSRRAFLDTLALAGFVFVVFSLVHWAVVGDTQYRGLTNHKNSLGVVLFFCFVGIAWALTHCQQAVSRLLYLYAAVACVALTYLTSSRAALLTLLTFSFFYATWHFWCANRRRYFLVLALVLLGSLLIVPLYVYLSFSPYATTIDQVSVWLSGQRFFTGRNFVWPAHLLLISQAPLWGHGFATESLALLKIAAGLSENYSGLSAHNLYIMIVTQTGLVGLAAFIVLITGLWHLCYRIRSAPSGRIVGALILAYLVHEIFEVSMTQNNLINAWLFWLIVGLSLRETHQPATA